jgi:glycosyltransferase involved in cell wall biosynthesis
MRERKSMPKVSFVLAVRDGEKFIQNTVSSILKQTYKNWELIIINDHSVDQTKLIVNKIAESNKQIKIFDLVDGEGVACARNFGNKKASGDILLPCDADDPIFPNRAEVSVFELSKQKVDIFYANLERYYLDTGNRASRHFQPYDAELLHYINYIAHGSTAYYKYVTEKIGGYDPEIKIGEDYDFWLKAQETGFKFGYKKINLAQYTMHSGQSTTANSAENITKRQLWNRTVRAKHKIFEVDVNYVKKQATPEVTDFYVNKNYEIWFGDKSIPKLTS